jgi:hypothetical protein
MDTTKDHNKKIDYLLRGGIAAALVCGVGLEVIAWPVKEERKGPPIESKLETIPLGKGNGYIFRNTFKIPYDDPEGKYLPVSGIVNVENSKPGTCEPKIKLYVQPAEVVATGIEAPLYIQIRGQFQFDELVRQINKAVIACRSSISVQ